MSRHVNAIAGRMSLRPPQRRSLEILDRITIIVPPSKETDIQAAVAAIHNEFPSVTNFEREFASVCFALATGVGKTRLMGAFISYLNLEYGIGNFFVMAPNLTIYNKLITDFTPNTPKYVFKGMAEYATNSPAIITGENYDQRDPISGTLDSGVCINIFNISKINSEVRGGKVPRIKRLSEYIGQSYFDYLAGLPNLVLIMDESHRYRASAGVKAINELKPVLGLELTATPFVETGKGPVPFKNVVYDYPLGKAMADGFVKEPAVVTRKNFRPDGMAPEEIERLKLEDGVRLHEGVKTDLETYARETDQPLVKPFLLVIARNTTHAGQLMHLIQSDIFFEGKYKEKVIQVDSSRTGAAEDEMVERLLKVEHTEEPTEIVIHVNMLKEGWDVTNLYTIVPLRAANARTLIEQSIGRGLRLPYGHRTGVPQVDRLNIVAHDHFQEIINEANRPDSAIRLQAVVLDDDQLQHKSVTVVAQSKLKNALGIMPEQATSSTVVAGSEATPAFSSPGEQHAAQLAYEAIRKLENQPEKLPGTAHLKKPEIQKQLVKEVQAQYKAPQQELEGVLQRPDIQAIVAKTAEMVIHGSIDIPRILIVPRGGVQSGFTPFEPDFGAMQYPIVSDELWIQLLRTHELNVMDLGRGGIEEKQLEDYVVDGLAEYDDISYDDCADLLYNLAGKTVHHFRSQLSEEDSRRILRCHQRDIARNIHDQMSKHHWEKAEGYDVKVTKGFMELRPCAYTAPAHEAPLEFRCSPPDKSNMAKYLFGGFVHCLYSVAKFQSEPERILAVILDRDCLKWFRPAKGQFQIHYKVGSESGEYQPDFVAETSHAILMIEAKEKSKMEDPEVLAKKDAAVEWCRHACNYTAGHGGKPWKYLLIPHDAIAENMTLQLLENEYAVKNEN